MKLGRDEKDFIIGMIGLIIMSIIVANLPDIVSFWLKTSKDHHQSIFHAPLFYLVLFFIGYFIFPFYIVLLFFVQTIFHLLTDLITARDSGIAILYPFIKKEQSLLKLNPDPGDYNMLSFKKKDLSMAKSYLKMYIGNKPLFLFEILLIILGLLSFFL